MIVIDDVQRFKNLDGAGLEAGNESCCMLNAPRIESALDEIRMLHRAIETCICLRFSFLAIHPNIANKTVANDGLRAVTFMTSDDEHILASIGKLPKLLERQFGIEEFMEFGEFDVMVSGRDTHETCESIF